MPVRVATFNSVSQGRRLRAERIGQWKFAEGGVCQRPRGISTHTVCLYARPAFPSKCHLRVKNSHCAGPRPRTCEDMGKSQDGEQLMGLEGSSEKNPGLRNPRAGAGLSSGQCESLSREPGCETGAAAGWPLGGAGEAYASSECRQAAARSQRPCPARAPSPGHQGRPAGVQAEERSQGRCPRQWRFLRRGNLKSRRLSRAMLPHGGAPGKRGKSTALPASFWGQRIRCCFSQQTEPPPVLVAASQVPPAQLPALHTDSKGSPQRLPGPTGAFLRSEEPHPFPLTGSQATPTSKVGPPAEAG